MSNMLETQAGKSQTSASINNTFKCNKCDFITENYLRFEWHVEKHSAHYLDDSLLHTCSKCSFWSKNKRLFKLHFFSHYDSKTVRCSKCSFSSYYKSALARHFKLLHSTDEHIGVKRNTEKEFKCKFCPFISNRLDKLKIHRTDDHFSKNVNGEIKCSKCDFKTLTHQGIREHLYIHMTDMTFQCIECKFATSFRSVLNRHILKHRPKDTKRFSCKSCDYKTNYAFALARHEGCHETKSFKCHVCNYEHFSKNALKEHIIKNHSL